MNTLLEALKNSVLITGLVMIMMMLIEYINIHSHGKSFRKLKKSPVKQVIVAASLGLIPGCVGGFAVVSLYTHKLLSFGALVAMMIASSGDEAFVLLALIPKTAVILFIALFLIGITAGIIIDRFYKKEVAPFEPEHYELHENCCSTHKHDERPIFGSKIKDNLRKLSRERLIIMTGVAIFIIAVTAGLLEHDHSSHQPPELPSKVTHTHIHTDNKVCIEDEPGNDHTHNHSSETSLHQHTHFDIFSERWINLIFAGVSLLTLFLTAKANEHFIKEHLWEHVVKKHFRSIFLWTTGALLVIHFGMQFLHIEEWIAQNMYIMILLAVGIGLVPESGPHMIFITLFAGGFIPFSVLLASSISQDGHTALPLLAESKGSFFKAKIINMFIGLTVGVLLHLAGF
ncbi:MAG: putative manganese transporter [Bacteroidales bacterium]|jgi:hypothetical protein|nr:putative manganese transporter [Bacteroidales bacterium]